MPAPGFREKDKMVKSRRGSAPHLVKVSNCQYLCDGQCPQFKLINIYFHVVAESNCDLISFMNWFCTKCTHGTSNLIKLAVHGMTPGVGCKGGKAPIDDNHAALSTASPSQASISKRTAKETRSQ